MSDFVVGACSSSDLPPEYAAARKLIILPYHYVIDGKEYLENQEGCLRVKAFYDKLREGFNSTTSSVNPETFKALFRSVLEQGKDIIYVVLSSGLSATYSHAKMVAEKLSQEFPERKLYIVDSLSATAGFALLVHFILNMRDEGKSIDEVYEWALQNNKKIIHWFVVESLEYLRRGGRITHASAFLGTALNIKPVLRFDDEGKIIPVDKIRGRKKSLIELVNKMEGQFEHPENAPVYISHGDSLEDAQFVERLVHERYPQIRETVVLDTGPVIGSHTGPGIITLHYLGNKR